MRYLARICYDGSKFMGFQRLNNGQGVQNVLENVLSKIAGKKVEVKGAGRTDRGVHALDQCIHFDFDKDISVSKLKYSMNQMLPKSISVTSISMVSSSFHARHSVQEKTYFYKVYLGEKNPFLSSFAYSISYDLNYSLMEKACKLFLGLHDFHNFVSGYREDYTSFLSSFVIRKDGDFLIFEVKGKSFYRYMVRSLVGAVLDVGRGKVTLEDLDYVLNNPDCERRFFVAPPEGLYLAKIEY